jgi:hypothetical protein
LFQIIEGANEQNVMIIKKAECASPCGLQPKKAQLKHLESKFVVVVVVVHTLRPLLVVAVSSLSVPKGDFEISQ